MTHRWWVYDDNDNLLYTKTVCRHTGSIHIRWS